MYSFSHQLGGDATGLPQYPHFADILKTLKGHTATRLMLDGQAACDCLRGEEQHEHRMRRTLWEGYWARSESAFPKVGWDAAGGRYFGSPKNQPGEFEVVRTRNESYRREQSQPR